MGSQYTVIKQWTKGLIPGMGRDFFHHSVQTGSRIHPASYPSAKVKNTYTFSAWWEVIKCRLWLCDFLTQSPQRNPKCVPDGLLTHNRRFFSPATFRDGRSLITSFKEATGLCWGWDRVQLKEGRARLLLLRGLKWYSPEPWPGGLRCGTTYCSPILFVVMKWWSSLLLHGHCWLSAPPTAEETCLCHHHLANCIFIEVCFIF